MRRVMRIITVTKEGERNKLQLRMRKRIKAKKDEIYTSSAPNALRRTRRSIDMDSGMVKMSL